MTPSVSSPWFTGSSPAKQLLLGLGALCAVAATGCVSAAAEVEEMEVTRHDLAFEGVPLASGQTVSLTQSFVHQRSPLNLPPGVDSDIRPTTVTLTGVDGADDLSFIEGLFVVLKTNRQGVEQSHVILTYEGQGATSEGGVLRIPSEQPPNLIDAWRTNSGVYEVTVWGKLPEQGWSVDLTIAFTGSFKYDL
jgi:hypothetical protein